MATVPIDPGPTGAGPIDPGAVKAQQRTTWDAISAGWEVWHERFEAAAAPVTVRLLHQAGIRPGHRVLDLGSGIGEPALSAARLVGPAGRVTGVDLSPEMVVRARRRAGQARNIEFVEGDFEELGLPEASFDVVLSRWGLMFATNRPRTLAALGRLLVSGGVLAAAVWGPPDVNPMMSLGFRVLTGLLDLPAPPPGSPGPFTMSDPASVAAELTAAGFAEAEVTPCPMRLQLASAAEYAEFARALLPPGVRATVGERLGPDGEREAWGRVRAAAAEYPAPAGGVSVPGLALCLRAVTVGGAREPASTLDG